MCPMAKTSSLVHFAKILLFKRTSIFYPTISCSFISPCFIMTTNSRKNSHCRSVWKAKRNPINCSIEFLDYYYLLIFWNWFIHICIRKVKWCMSCRTEEQFGCATSGHLSVLMPVEVVKDAEKQLIQGFITQSCKTGLLNSTEETTSKYEKLEKRSSIRTKIRTDVETSSSEYINITF